MYFYRKWQLDRVLVISLRFSMALGTLLSVFMVLGYFFAGAIYEYNDTVVNRGQLPPVDAIVCLAGGRGRIAQAGDVWLLYWEKAHRAAQGKVGATPRLYFAGLGPQAGWGQLSKQFRPGVQEVIRSQDVFIERESSNTVTNALQLADYAKAFKWKRVLLLTSPYHMKRANLIFHQVLHSQGSGVDLETWSTSQEPFTSSDWKSEAIGIRVTLVEYVKWLYYRLFWKVESHPTRVSQILGHET
jgi:uncharacterized SAM-binding protein YcdF (DUF218 family)